MHGDKRYLLDTNVVIGILGNNTPLTGNLKIDPLIAISVITEIELLFFSRLTLQEEAGIKGFLAVADITYLNPAIKDITIQLRRKHGIKTPDAIIAATAIQTRAVLVSDDSVLLRLKETSPISAERFSEILR